MLKGYLAKFSNNQPDKNIEKPRGEVPTKPTKPGFVGFDGRAGGENSKDSPTLATLARPLPVRADSKPARCLFDDCGGDLVTRGPLWLCLACGAWFSWAGPLSDDDKLIINVSGQVCD